MKIAKKERDPQKISEAAGNLSIYMNVLDGLAHNNGSFLDKMIRNEISNTGGTGNPFAWKYPAEALSSRIQEVARLMDAKEFSDKDNVLPLLKPHLDRNPDAFLYQEYYRDLLRKSNPDPEQAQRELEVIRFKKYMIAFLKSLIDDHLLYMMSKKLASNDFSQNRVFALNIVEIPKYSRYFGHINDKNSIAYAVQQIIADYNLTDIETENIPELVTEYMKSYIASSDFNEFIAIVQCRGSNIARYHVIEQEDGTILVNDTMEFFGDLPRVYIDRDDLLKGNNTKEFLERSLQCLKDIRNTIVKMAGLGLPYL